MIKEVYCSKEISKLLKEKGFNEEVISYYDTEDQGYFVSPRKCNIGTGSIYAAPTQQMAMCWLREVHSIHIIIRPYTEMEGHNWSFIFDKFAYGCWQELAIYITDSWNTYEEACEAAIKYCLENLI